MIPNKELQEFARAIQRTEEYTEMMKHRSNVMGNPMLGRQLMAFEREQSRIMNSNMPPADISARLKRLYEENKYLMEKEEVKRFVESSTHCQKMIAESVSALNRMLESHASGRMY